MKAIIVILSLVVYSQAIDKEFVDKFMDELKVIGDQCIGETGATKDDLVSLLAHTIPESHEGKCLIFCFHKHFDMQDESGNLNKDGFLNALEALKAHDEEVYNKFVQIYDTCSVSVPTNSDPCEYAGALATCGVKEGHAMGLKEDLFLE
nr:odorant-binding protein 5 [Lytta caraganae]